jgi:hypothetical protein
MTISQQSVGQCDFDATLTYEAGHYPEIFFSRAAPWRAEIAHIGGRVHEDFTRA